MRVLEDHPLASAQVPSVSVPWLGAETRAPARRQLLRLHGAMACVDILLVACALVLSHAVVYGLGQGGGDLALMVALSPVLTPGMFGWLRLYHVHRLSGPEEFRRLLLATSILISGLVFISFWSDFSLSRGWIGVSWLLTLALILPARGGWRAYLRKARSRGAFTFNTLIVGTSEEAQRIGHMMRDHKLGFRPLGHLALSEGDVCEGDLPTLGSIEQLREFVRSTPADCVFLTPLAADGPSMQRAWHPLRMEGVEVCVSAGLPEVLLSRLTVQPLGGLMALSVTPVRLSGVQATLKRAFDVVGATLGLILLSPLALAIAAAIRMTSAGPVLFKQERVGWRQQPFQILKFRTMVNGAESLLGSLKEHNEASGPLFKMKNDPRITRVGKWLRRWSMDEIPQLLNVLKGDMSLVGPRPPLRAEVESYEAWQVDRLEVRPGLTGLWQVSGRSDKSFEDYVKLDLFYIANWSLAYDLFIVLKTLPVLFSRRGAY